MATLGPYLRGFSVLDFDWILDSNRLRDSGFFELYFGFQSPVLEDSAKKFPQIPDFKSKHFLDSGIRIPLYIGRARSATNREQKK